VVEVEVLGLPEVPDGPPEEVDIARSDCKSGNAAWGARSGVFIRDAGGDGIGDEGTDRGRMLLGSCGNGNNGRVESSGDWMKEYEIGSGAHSWVAEGGVMLMMGGSCSCMDSVISNHFFLLPNRCCWLDPSSEKSSLSSSDLLILTGAGTMRPPGIQAREAVFLTGDSSLLGCDERRIVGWFDELENLLLWVPESKDGVWMGDREEV
jgi:hypothetical protein